MLKLVFCLFLLSMLDQKLIDLRFKQESNVDKVISELCQIAEGTLLLVCF